MKRRNADCGKLRRPLKRTKIAENIYCSSTFLYVKFLLVWAVVLLADFILEFRFEYLWPFWLLLRSMHDSFKYQGLAFSVFFICIALTADMICFLLIPVHWLFFAASTYVWVQYVWHTERGLCLPTVSLWLLFVYIEASVRLKELKNITLHLDLCRPFAAHCIGYPVVTLGFGFKSYIGYKMRQRKQKEVAKENDFYIHLLQQALPFEQTIVQSSPEKSTQSKSTEDKISESISTNSSSVSTNGKNSSSSRKAAAACTITSSSSPPQSKNSETTGGGVSSGSQRFSEVVDNKQQTRHVMCNGTSGGGSGHHHHHNHTHHNHHNPNHRSSSLEKELEQVIERNYTESNHVVVGGTGGGGNDSGGGGGSGAVGANNNNINDHHHHHHSSQQQHHHKQQQPRTSINDFDESNDLEHDKSFKANGVIHKMAAGGGGGSGSSPLASNNSSGSSSSTRSSSGGGGGGGVGVGGGSGGWASSSSSSSSSSLSGGSAGATSKTKDNGVAISVQPSSGKKNKVVKDNTTANNNNLNSQKDDHVLRLESDIKRLKADLQASRQCEQDLRMQINSLAVSERSTKNELLQSQQDNESLQSKLHGLVTARQQDKQTISSLERKLQEERKCRTVIESQLATERKNKKAEEAAARAVAMATANTRNECTESCKARRRDLESDVKGLRRDFKMCEDRLRLAEREAQALRQYKDSHSEAEVLMSALAAMQDKNAHLENSLSAETRLKLDLFSALGEAKRQLEITQSSVLQRDKQIEDLKSKIAEVMAVMPPTTFSPVSLDSSLINPPLYSSKFMPNEEKVTYSTLDPNAVVYTPKGIVCAAGIVSAADL